MTKQIAAYVTGAICCAAIAFAVTFVMPAIPVEAPWGMLLALALLGVLAEVLMLLLPTNAAMSIAAVPFLAAALISPTWRAVALVAGAMAASQLLHRRQLIKGAFNVAQTTIAISAAVLAYRAVGGKSLITFGSLSFIDVTAASGIPAVLLICTFILINTALVSGVIALSEGNSLIQVWRRNHLSTLGYEMLSVPFIFFFGWVTVKIGPLGAALLGVPAVGFHQLYKTKLDLERAHQDLLQLMVKAIEARDPYTSGHSRRVQQYAMIIARALGLSIRESERIGFAALLHDVGKIHDIYAPILRKPERLSPEERAIMQTHSLRSAELVGTVSSLKDLVAPIRHHHENWDGSGYPDGLVGEAIPLASRIIMFADTIDAMTTDRPYRKALNESQVRAELEKFRGKQFDPYIYDRLVASPLFHSLFASPVASASPQSNRRISPPRPVRAIARG
ncbi:MAG TPA: HD-GYP domain-containing protein [Gemmatimonadaceae bacterium]